MTWYGTPGGATSEAWGAGWQVHLYVAIAIATGNPWTMGTHPYSNLNRGNVMSRSTALGASAEGRWRVLPGNLAAGPPPEAGKLWVDVSCDVESVATHMGATDAQGVAAKAEAGTSRVTLVDPDGLYDPLNADSPFQYRGRSRLIPGTAICIWAEWQAPGATVAEDVTLFTGWVESWTETWTPHPNKRRAVVTCSDLIARLANFDREEQPAIGANETTLDRYNRILDFFAIPAGSRGHADSFGPARLQATTLAQSAWELLTRLADDEVGMVFVDTYNRVNFVGQQIWTKTDGPTVYWGCAPGEDSYDCVVAASVGGFNYKIRNAVFGARVGGTTQSVVNNGSVAQYGYFAYKRTDLGLYTDADSLQWANIIVLYSATPTVRMTDFSVNPAIDPACWPSLGTMVKNLLGNVHMYWKPPDRSTAYDIAGRTVGFETTVSRNRWEFKWSLAQPSLIQTVWSMGPDPNSNLDRGNMMGLYPST